MGMEQTVRVSRGSCPPWEEVRRLLAEKGIQVEMRMIEGELAFPDEAPPEGWKEIRLGTSEGMVTVRRSDEQLSFVTWGDARGGVRRVWDAVTWAYAHLSGGAVQAPEGAVSAEELRERAGISS